MAARNWAPSLHRPIAFARLGLPLGMPLDSNPNRMKRSRLPQRRLKAGDVLAMDFLAEFVDFVLESALLKEVHRVRSRYPRKEIGYIRRVEMYQFVNGAHEIPLRRLDIVFDYLAILLGVNAMDRLGFHSVGHQGGRVSQPIDCRILPL